MSETRGVAAILGLMGLALLTGCGRRLAGKEFLHKYESQCARTLEKGEFGVVILYENPDYLAAMEGGDSLKAHDADSLKAAYGAAHYVRISIRSRAYGTEDEMASSQTERQTALGRFLGEGRDRFRQSLKLEGPDGQSVEPLAVSFQAGAFTGAANTFIAVFPKESRDGKVDLKKWDLVIGDFGLNLGTLRSRLALPKGIRLKVAA